MTNYPCFQWLRHGFLNSWLSADLLAHVGCAAHRKLFGNPAQARCRPPPDYPRNRHLPWVAALERGEFPGFESRGLYPLPEQPQGFVLAVGTVLEAAAVTAVPLPLKHGFAHLEQPLREGLASPIPAAPQMAATAVGLRGRRGTPQVCFASSNARRSRRATHLRRPCAVSWQPKARNASSAASHRGRGLAARRSLPPRCSTGNRGCFVRPWGLPRPPAPG